MLYEITYRKKPFFCQSRPSALQVHPFFPSSGKTPDRWLSLSKTYKLLQLSRFMVLFDTSVKSNTTDERINVTLFLCTAVIQRILFFLLQKQFKCRQGTVCFLYRHIILLSHHAVTQGRPWLKVPSAGLTNKQVCARYFLLLLDTSLACSFCTHFLFDNIKITRSVYNANE